MGELFPLLQVFRESPVFAKSQKCLQDHFEKEKGRQDLTASLELSKCGNMKRLLGRELKRVELRKKLEDRKSQQKPEEEGKPAKKCWKCGISSRKVDLSKCSACRRAWWVVLSREKKYFPFSGIVVRSVKKLIGSPTGSGASRRWSQEARRR